MIKASLITMAALVAASPAMAQTAPTAAVAAPTDPATLAEARLVVALVLNLLARWLVAATEKRLEGRRS